MHKNPGRAVVVGASGYTGQELVRLLSRHAHLRLGWATSESEAGAPVRGWAGLRYTRAAAVPLGAADVVFTCLPTGESAEWTTAARAAGARVIDLSADLRQGAAGAVYGLPELWREAVRGVELVANPGCYPTGVLLTLAPLLSAGVVSASRPVIVNAASGVTGAGRSARRELLYGEVAEDYRAYGVGNTHRHVPEIAAGLTRLSGGLEVPFVFTPHLLPVRRGILETLYVPVAAGVRAADVAALLAAAYGAERFVEVCAAGAGSLPSLAGVVHTNRIAMGCADVAVAGDPLVICVTAFDNLLKGGAGQALQNANLLLGLCEGEGLPT